MESASAVSALSALAQEQRLAAYRLLVQAGAPGLSAGNIADALGMPASTLSFHLRQLEHAGLVLCRKAGRQRIYAADFAAMNALLAYLTENCCGGDEGRCEPLQRKNIA